MSEIIKNGEYNDLIYALKSQISSLTRSIGAALQKPLTSS
jgi:hypothetical protein